MKFLCHLLAKYGIEKRKIRGGGYGLHYPRGFDGQGIESTLQHFSILFL